ncbi:MAG: arylesterase [Thiomicrorhabdus sp.]|nr:arylesterase [Thiomicrorhabdus sp.]
MRNAVWLFTMLIGFITLTSCSQPSVNKLEEGAVIVAFGDSLTQGVGVSSDKSYPAVLQTLTGYKVINAGVSGETTAEGVARFSQVLAREQPQLVILFEGGNDILKNTPFEQIKDNLATMIAEAKAHNVSVLLVGVPQKSVFFSSAELYESLADQWNIPLENDIVSHLMRRTSMKSDYIHFNEKGYQKLAEAIYLKLQESGAI